jgi:intraflagellar transport protein 52
MKLSIYPPAFKEPTHPQLELFDLDDEFSSESTQLAQLTNKCNDDDLEYFLREAGKIIGLPTEVINGGGKRVLATVLRHIVNWKTLNPEPVV